MLRFHRLDSSRQEPRLAIKLQIRIIRKPNSQLLCRGPHESVDLVCQHAEALLLQNAGADTLQAVQAAIASLLHIPAGQHS